MSTTSGGNVNIPTDGVTLPGDLEVPPTARAMVVFAHGSGSSRLSPRNRAVAQALRAPGRFGTLLFDLLTPDEDLVTANRFDIDLLAGRLLAASDFLRNRTDCCDLPQGYFGASTGAAAAIIAAADAPEGVRAVVSRGGRPDLAGKALTNLRVPTLFIVGGLDVEVIALNAEALSVVPAEERRLEIVPGATHLFEEPGTLEEVSRLALAWFEHYLDAEG